MLIAKMTHLPAHVSKTMVYRTSSLQRIATCVALVVGYCLSAVPAEAAPMLLAEFSYDNGASFVPGTQLPSAVNFSFTAGLGSPDTATFWITHHTPSEIGQTIVAPPNVVAGIANVVSNPNAIYYMGIGPQPGGFGGYDDLGPPTGNDGGLLRLQLLVSNPTSYRVTNVERTLDNVILQLGNGRFYHIGGKQTVRLYGIFIPEPAGSLLLVTGLVQLSVSRRYGSIGRR